MIRWGVSQVAVRVQWEAACWATSGATRPLIDSGNLTRMGEGSISPAGIVAAVLMLAMFAFLSKLYGRDLWRDEAKLFRYDAVPSWWVWGDATWHAYVRPLLFGSVGFVVVILVGLFLEFGPSWLVDGEWFTVLLAVVSFGWLGGMVTIALFNRPKSFVAPPLRGKPGLLRELWNSRSRPTSTM